MIVKAVYREDNLPLNYLGNPYIEALPPLGTAHDSLKAILHLPAVDMMAARGLPTLIRAMEVDILDSLYLPPPIAVDFMQTVDHLLRRSYSARNPLRTEVIAEMYDEKWLVAAQNPHGTTLDGAIFLEGESGGGKSRLVKVVLSRLPKGIRHSNYKGKAFNQTQAIWISAEAPVNGSIQGLMMRFLNELDAAIGYENSDLSYAKNLGGLSLERMISGFAVAARTHGLGIVHVDDLQRISSSATYRNRALQFVIQLATQLKCLLVFSGTPESIEFFQKNFEAARRLCSAGYFKLERPRDPGDKFHAQLTQQLLRYQFTSEPLEYSETLSNYLLKMSAGVTSVTILLHKFAQKIAIKRGDKILKIAHFNEAYRTRLKPLRSCLATLRGGSMVKDQMFSEALAKVKESDGGQK